MIILVYNRADKNLDRVERRTPLIIHRKQPICRIFLLFISSSCQLTNQGTEKEMEHEGSAPCGRTDQSWRPGKQGFKGKGQAQPMGREERRQQVEDVWEKGQITSRKAPRPKAAVDRDRFGKATIPSSPPP